MGVSDIVNQSYHQITSLHSHIGMHQGGRVSLILLTLLILTVGILGNGVVLYCSFIKHVVKMDRLSLILIHSNATCDMLLMLVIFLPLLVVLCGDGYVLGDVWCVFTAYFIPDTPLIYGALVNATGTVVRVWLLNKPPGVKDIIPRRYAYYVMGAAVFLATVPNLLFAGLGGHAWFNPTMLCCVEDMSSTKRIFAALHYIYSIIMLVTPVAALVTGNLYAGFIIRRSLKKSKSTTTEQKCRVCLTINAVCWSFIVAYLPVVIILVLKLVEVVPVYSLWYILPLYCISITAVSNPFIVYISNVGFRGYINNVVRSWRVEKKEEEVEEATRGTGCGTGCGTQPEEAI